MQLTIYATEDKAKIFLSLLYLFKKSRADMFTELLLAYLSVEKEQVKSRLSYYFTYESKVKAITARKEVNKKGYDEKKGSHAVKKMREVDEGLLFLSKIIAMELSEEERRDAEALDNYVGEENERGGFQLEEVDEDDELRIALGKL